MSTEVSIISSRNGKLNTGMTIESLSVASYKSEKDKNKAISLFQKTDKNNDGRLDNSEIKAYDKKQTLKKVGLVAAGILGVAVAGLFAYKGLSGKNIFSIFKKTSVPDTEAIKKAVTVDGKVFLSSSEISDLSKNCQRGFVNGGKPIPNYLEKIKAVMSNPKEVKVISKWKCKPAGIWRAIQDPLNSTIEANPHIKW